MALMKPVLVFAVVLLSLHSTASYGYRGRMVGGKTEIPDVEANTEVQELGRFAVEEYNRNLGLWRIQAPGDGGAGEGERVEFREVVKGQRQVVAGIKYYLKISATQNRNQRMFDSVVVVKPWLRSKQLLNFAPSFQ